MHVHQPGQLSALAGEHVGHRRARGGRGEKAVVGHPLVIENLGQVAAAGVREQHDDQAGGVELRRDPQRPRNRQPAGPAHQQALLPGQPAGHQERLLVADRLDPVHHRLVVGLRPEVLADALDQVRPAGAAGVNRALRVGADDLHRRVALLEVAPGATDGAAGADAGDEVRDPAVGLPPDLRPGRLVVRPGVVLVAVLVRAPAARDLRRQPLGHRVVGVRAVRRYGGGADHHVRAVRPQDGDLLGAHLVRHDEHAPVALAGSDDRQADAGVAAGRLHHGTARAQLAAGLRRFHHGQRDPVLHGATGIEVLHLGHHCRRQAGRHRAQSDQRGVAHQVDQRVVQLHDRVLSNEALPRGPAARPLRERGDGVIRVRRPASHAR